MRSLLATGYSLGFHAYYHFLRLIWEVKFHSLIALVCWGRVRDWFIIIICVWGLYKGIVEVFVEALAKRVNKLFLLLVIAHTEIAFLFYFLLGRFGANGVHWEAAEVSWHILEFSLLILFTIRYIGRWVEAGLFVLLFLVMKELLCISGL